MKDEKRIKFTLNLDAEQRKLSVVSNEKIVHPEITFISEILHECIEKGVEVDTLKSIFIALAVGFDLNETNVQHIENLLMRYYEE